MVAKFIHERQRTPHDCVVCSLAMYLRRPYEQVLDRLISTCRNTKISWTPDEPVPVPLMRLVSMAFRRTIVTMQEVPPDTPVILTLASERADWLHVVFMDADMTVFDPLHGVEPATFDPELHLFSDAHVALRHLAPWVLREVDGGAIASWPEIELQADRARRALHG